MLCWLKTVIRGAKIIFSVTLRVIMGSVGFIAHVRVIWVWRLHFNRFYGPQYLRKCCKLETWSRLCALDNAYLPPIAHEGFCLVYGKPFAHVCPRWKSLIATIIPLLMLETVQCLHILCLWSEGLAARSLCHKAHAPFATPWHLHSAFPQNLWGSVLLNSSLSQVLWHDCGLFIVGRHTC